VPFFDRHSFDCNQRAILHLAAVLRLGISPPAYARSLDHAGLIFEDQGLVLDPSDGDLRPLLDFARARGKHPDRGEGYFLRTPRHHYLIVEDRGAVALRAVTLSEQPDLVAPLEPLASLLLDAASGASDAGTARSYAELALVLDPGNADAHDTLGNLAADLEPVLAAAEYEAALALDPHSARVHYNLGVLLHSQGEIAAAAAEYRAALVLQPTLIAATENLAGLLAIRSGGPAPSQRGTTTFPAFPLP
jgi:tetratricopeptide (TPR) repeat protein